MRDRLIRSCWMLVGVLLTVAAVAAPVAMAAAPAGGVTNFRLPDHLGHEHSLDDYSDSKLVVVAFLGTECPLAKLYAGRLQALADQFGSGDVAVIAIDSNRQDSLSEIAAFVRRHELTYPVLKDRNNRVADLLGAERTPQVFLLDANRMVQYQGRVDDQYVVGIVRDEATREDLKVAIDQLLAGKPVSVPETEPLGCIIGRVRPVEETGEVTYTRDIAPILQARCVDCHRDGEIGPFELTSYDEVAGWGEMIAEVVRERRMPPWHANPAHGEFANDRSMTDEEKELIFEWVKNGCPEGDAADLPEPVEYTSGWQLPREPDLVFAMPEPFTVPADAGSEGVAYQYFSVPSEFEEDTWIEATEIQPGNRQVVHHTIVYAQPPEGSRRDWIFLSAYVPGLRFDPLPESSAKRVPAGSTFIFEMHYTPVGSVQEDVTKIGLLLADVDEIEQEVITAEIGNNGFEIPPHDPEHVVTATSLPLEREVTLISFSPHMHLRGKSFRYELVTPTGEREVLLDVPAYDFNWQTRYLLKTPRTLPAGSIIHCRAAFDNSADNLANPDPEATVRWGDQSWEEMMLGFFDVVLPRDDDRPAGQKPIGTGLDIVGMFDAADVDQSGGLSDSEVAGQDLLTEHFAAIDVNQDKQLQLGELLAAVAALGK